MSNADISFIQGEARTLNFEILDADDEDFDATDVPLEFVIARRRGGTAVLTVEDENFESKGIGSASLKISAVQSAALSGPYVCELTITIASDHIEKHNMTLFVETKVA